MTVFDDLGALDVIPEPILLLTADARIAGVNRALAQHLGLPAASMHGRPLTDFLDGPAESTGEYLRMCASSGQMVPGLLALRPASGDPIAYRAHGARCQSRSDSALRILIRLMPKRETVSAFVALNEQINALNAEIVRRRQAEAMLVREREMLEVTLASIGDAVIVTNAQGRVTFMNSVAAALTGWEPAQAKEQPLREVFSIRDELTGEPLADRAGAVLATGKAVSRVNRSVLIQRDGTPIPIDESVAPIRLPDGALCGVVLSFRDIRPRRDAEEERLEVDRRRDEFLAILAHELRNPLAPIRNAMEIMRVSADDAATIAASRVIVERQLTHLTRLIDDLMDVSRITQGKIELRKEHTVLSAVLQMAVEIARPQLEGRQHSLQIELPSEGLYLVADPHRLAQTFANLLENAAKYSAAGAPIRIEAGASNGEIVVRVIDHGIGIPQEMLERIFELFAQVDRSGHGSLEGLGIGLTLVRRIVELHGGSVIAESEGRDRGSRFIVRLPRASAFGNTHAAQEAPPQDASGRKLRILVADDNRDAAQTLAMMLRLEGHEVRAVHDGAEALTVGDTFQPELILLDIGMPVVDGYATARLIRKRPWGKQPYLIALTGWGQDADRRKALAAGFHEHVVKPAPPEVLNAIIHRVTGHE